MGIRAVAIESPLQDTANRQQVAIKTLRESGDLAARILAARTLRDQPGSNTRDQSAALLENLERHNLSLRAMALQALAKMKLLTAQTDRILEIALDSSEDLYVRTLAVLALGAPDNRSDKTIADLVDLLGNVNRDIAYYSATALSDRRVVGKTSFTNTVAALTRTLAHGNAQQQRFALFALARLGNAIGPLLEPTTPATKALASRIEQLMYTPDPAIRTNACEAFSRIWPAGALVAIQPLLDDSNATVARGAATAICFLEKDETARDRLLTDFRKRTAWHETTNEHADELHIPTPPSRPGTHFEVGGPLAGLALPLFPTFHGEPAGHPGNSDGAPEQKLHAESVEHWRAYWFKYCNVRSFYDQQSLLHNWTVPEIPTNHLTESVTYAEPIYSVPRYAMPHKTGHKAPSVAVVQCTVTQPTFQLGFGTLAPGLYCVRVIGAVAEENPRQFMKPLFLAMTINDGQAGQKHTYRIRCGYVDQFYGIAEFYFQALEQRLYKAELFVAAGSEIDVLIHNIELHDALAGVTRAAIKRRPTTVEAPNRVDYASKYLTEERIARDADIWRGFPPLNKQFGHYRMMLSARHYQSPRDVVRFGQDGKSFEEIQSQYGKWTWARGQYPLFLVNDKMGLVYTYADLEAGRPLPDPYPFKDDGAGLYQADPQHPDKGSAWIPIAEQVSENIRYYGKIDTRKECDKWVHEGNIDAARDEAIRLIRIALQVPSYESSHALNNVVTNPTVYGRDSGMRRRQTQPDGTWLSHYPNYRQPVLYYDKLFTYIDGNEELAASVGRFVPWVKSSRDVIELLDTYLTQTVAKRTLRYQYYTSNSALAIADIALVMDNHGLTEPWIEWLFSKTFIYPLPVEGIQNLGITSSGRSGCSYIGSSFYASGEGAGSRARNVEQYLRFGLFPEQYDLRRADAYPKTAAHIAWHLNVIVGGHEFLRIGDVTGAERNAMTTFLGLSEYAPYAWRWFHWPRYAWIIKHSIGRTHEDDAQWHEIETAARQVKRAPWLDLASRQVYNWAGILESGLEHNDYRFRNVTYVRTGLGLGHHHADALDLQIVSHGLPMTVDGGQRPGYSTPGDRSTYVHNTVIVDQAGNHMQSWVRTIAAGPDTKFLSVAGAHPTANRYERQVALIDVDSGSGSKHLTAAEQQFDAALPTQGIVPANAYVVDVFRIDGGTQHTYAFHGPVSDEVVVEADNLKEISLPHDSKAANPEQALLSRFKRSPFHRAGDARQSTDVRWRYTRSGVGAESLHGNFDPASPRKFLKLHLFNTQGMRVLHAQGVTHARNYRLDHVFTQRRAQDDKPLATVFAAVIQPYAGQPFIESQKMLEIENNSHGVARAVAIEVQTTNGHRDIVFMDGEPDQLRDVEDMHIAAQYVFFSTDDRGLRSATLHGGTCLSTPILRVNATQRTYQGKIREVNYLKKQITLDTVWPDAVAGSIVRLSSPGRETSYTIKELKNQNGSSVVTLDQGAKFYRSQIESIDGQTIKCRLTVPLGRKKGLDRGFTVANDHHNRFWHADYVGGSSWQLSGEPVTSADFAADHSLTVYEYGPGDTVETETSVSVTRKRDGSFMISCNTPCTVAFRAQHIQVSRDRKTWKPAGKQIDEQWTAIACEPSMPPVHVRLARTVQEH